MVKKRSVFYPDVEKAENIQAMNRNFEGGIKLSTWEIKCPRCQQIMPIGTEIIWLRARGSFHKQNPCPIKTDEQENNDEQTISNK